MLQRISRLTAWEPAIGEPADPLHHDIGVATNPERDRPLDRHWVQSGLRNRVVPTLEVDHIFGPEGTKQLDLLLKTATPVAEPFVQADVLNLVPTNPDAQPQLATGQDVDFGGLLRDQRGLTLRKDHDAGNKLQFRRDSRQIAEENEHFMEEALVGVWATPIGSVDGTGAKDMVIDQQVGMAGAFCHLRVFPNDGGIRSDLSLWKDNTDLHGSPCFYSNALLAAGGYTRRMSVRRNRQTGATIPEAGILVARQALAESRLRGLPAAEEYRVISDRLYRSGIRDLPPGALIDWIERTVEVEYERFIELRALGERFHAAIAAGDLAQAAWSLGAELDRESRRRLIDGLIRLNDLETE